MTPPINSNETALRQDPIADAFANIRAGNGNRGAGSYPLPAEGLDWLEQEAAGVLRCGGDNVPAPTVTASDPTEESDIEIEWWGQNAALSFEVELAKHEIYWHIAWLGESRFEEDTIRISSKADWQECKKVISYAFKLSVAQ